MCCAGRAGAPGAGSRWGEAPWILADASALSGDSMLKRFNCHVPMSTPFKAVTALRLPLVLRVSLVSYLNLGQGY